MSHLFAFLEVNISFHSNIGIIDFFRLGHKKDPQEKNGKWQTKPNQIKVKVPLHFAFAINAKLLSSMLAQLENAINWFPTHFGNL